MEQEQDPVMQENAKIKAIKAAHKKAFVYVNRALSTDELGQKAEAKNYYRQGLDHLLRGIAVPSHGPECTGPHWESARQMQQKMRQTLENVKARLNILEEGAQLNPAAETPGLYPAVPSRENPERLAVPHSLPAAGGSVGSTSQGQPAVMSPTSPMAQTQPSEAPPAYTPEATGGHYTVSYGTDSGEFSSVGDEFYAQCAQPPPIQNFGVDAEELILIPRGVQIFYVTPDGQVTAPSYPGYLRIVRFLDNDGAAAQNRPPAFLQVMISYAVGSQ